MYKSPIYISWQELEEWKATQETLSEGELMSNLRKGLRDEQRADVVEVGL